MSVRITDCTIRDGGYLLNKNSDPEFVKGIMKGLNELMDIQEEMRDYINRLITFYPSDKPYRVFFNSGFFSIEQIYFLSSISSSTEEFIENIMGLKYVTFGTKDFWAEVDMKLNMQSVKQRDE